MFVKKWLSVGNCRLPRSKGQFFSEKTVDCGGNNTKDSGPSNSLRYLNGCTHCGIGSNSTPMMRIGPAGPKSLCNACGLYWKNTGRLRDLSSRSKASSHDLPEVGHFLHEG
uniref:GATA-type domain-containing protein n=1 Tax=Kalanchoe fedtschenkoi TaxID=63787 RepID=A0A7N0UVD2_KALFE